MVKTNLVEENLEAETNVGFNVQKYTVSEVQMSYYYCYRSIECLKYVKRITFCNIIALQSTRHSSSTKSK